ncbi:TonB-dependent receptor [soil metagenome]
MPRRNLSHRKSMLMGASALVLCAAAPITAFAQTAPAAPVDTIEEVVVTGQRAALQSAQKLKQNAEQLVDSITATDIGALPDRSVTEALQRISGVTIGRTAEARDASRLSIEGSGVQVRGLSWVRGELNGRDSFSAKSGRALSFEDISPELMAGVDVYKNPSADLVEGGVGGTVNLRTRTPFDQVGRVVAYSADYSYGDLRKKWEPSVSGLFSDRWDTPIGEIGVLLNASYSKLESRADTISVDPYNVRTDLEPGKTVYVPGGYGYRSLNLDRERRGWASVLQWRPNDMMEITGQIIQSSAKQAASEHAIGFDPGTGNGPAAGTTFSYDSTGHFLKGTMAQSAGGTTLGSSTMDARYNERNSTTTDYSLNVKFNPNDKWAFSFDNQYVFAKTKSVDFTAFDSFFDQPAPTLDLTGSVPYITMPTDQTQAADPNNYYLNAAMDHHDRNQASEWAQRFDGEYTFDDDGWLKSFRFGVRHAKRDATTRETNYRWNSVVPSWSGDVTPGVRPTVNNIPELAGYYGLYTFDNYFRGDVHLPASFILPTDSLVRDYAKGSKIISGIAQKYAGGGWQAFNGDYSSFNAGGGNGGVNVQSEETLAAFGLLRFANDVSWFGGEAKTLDGNIGVRVVQTKAKGVGSQSYSNAGLNPSTNPDIPASDQAFGNGATSVYQGGRTYTNVLPSFNLRLKVSPEFFLRFATAKSIVRPDFNQLQPIYNISANTGYANTPGGTCNDAGAGGGVPDNCVFQYTAYAGNPALKPIRSTQFDFAAEWYFAPAGSLTGTVFHKDIYNFIANSPTLIPFTNNGVTKNVLVTQPYNAGHGTINGFEVAYQQYFDFLPGALKGIGVQANYTYVDSKGARNAAANPYDSSQVTQAGAQELPLEGLSKNSYNLAALYDYGPISARLAYNWRQQYLLTTAAANINIPAWAGDYGQLDGSVIYTINPKLKFGIQAVNLTNTRTKILVSYPGRPEEGKTIMNWVDSDRRVSLVLRGTF